MSKSLQDRYFAHIQGEKREGGSGNTYTVTLTADDLRRAAAEMEGNPLAEVIKNADSGLLEELASFLDETDEAASAKLSETRDEIRSAYDATIADTRAREAEDLINGDDVCAALSRLEGGLLRPEDFEGGFVPTTKELRERYEAKDADPSEEDDDGLLAEFVVWSAPEEFASFLLEEVDDEDAAKLKEIRASAREIYSDTMRAGAAGEPGGIYLIETRQCNGGLMATYAISRFGWQERLVDSGALEEIEKAHDVTCKVEEGGAGIGMVYVEGGNDLWENAILTNLRAALDEEGTRTKKASEESPPSVELVSTGWVNGQPIATYLIDQFGWEKRLNDSGVLKDINESFEVTTSQERKNAGLGVVYVEGSDDTLLPKNAILARLRAALDEEPKPGTQDSEGNWRPVRASGLTLSPHSIFEAALNDPDSKVWRVERAHPQLDGSMRVTLECSLSPKALREAKTKRPGMYKDMPDSA